MHTMVLVTRYLSLQNFANSSLSKIGTVHSLYPPWATTAVAKNMLPLVLVALQMLITVHHSHQWISLLSYPVIVMDNLALSDIAINATALCCAHHS
jgi:hypothetical protein